MINLYENYVAEGSNSRPLLDLLSDIGLLTALWNPALFVIDVNIGKKKNPKKRYSGLISGQLQEL